MKNLIFAAALLATGVVNAEQSVPTGYPYITGASTTFTTSPFDSSTQNSHPLNAEREFNAFGVKLIGGQTSQAFTATPHPAGTNTFSKIYIKGNQGVRTIHITSTGTLITTRMFSTWTAPAGSKPTIKK